MQLVQAFNIRNEASAILWIDLDLIWEDACLYSFIILNDYAPI